MCITEPQHVKKAAQDEVLGDIQVRIVRSPDKIAENNKKQHKKKKHKKKNKILKSLRKAAKQPRIEKIKSSRNRKRKGKSGGRNTKLAKKNKRKRMKGNRKKLIKSYRKTQAKRQSIVLTGESCDFIDFGSVRNVGAGCTDGTKMVVKNK